VIALVAGGCALAGGETRVEPPPGEVEPGAETDATIFGSEDAARYHEGVDVDPSAGGTVPPSLCYAGAPEAGLFECDDTVCEGVASCRVGSGTLCGASQTTSLDLSACDGAVTAACLGLDASIFGAPSPWVSAGGLHPGGTDFDSGVALEPPLALRSRRAVLTGTFRAPTCADGEACIETVSFGVTVQDALGASSRVSPLLALRYVAGRSEVQLVSGDVVLARRPFVAGGAHRLELRPNGIAIASDASGVIAEVPFAPRDGARVVVYGRNVNHGFPSTEGARLEGLSVDVARCDIPDAWGTRDPLSVIDGAGGAVSLDGVSGVATAVLATEGRVVAFHALDTDGRPAIFAATETESSELVLLGTDNAPILSGRQEHERGGVRDPEIWVDGAGTTHVYYTAMGADGVTRIGRASGAALTELAPSGSALLDPAAWDDLAGLSEPTVTTAYDGRLVLVANAALTSGAHALVTFVADSPTGPFARLRGTPLDAITQRDGSVQTPVFDAEEISSPSLRRVGGAFHLYYVGRHGTRRGLGLFATDDFLHVRRVSDEAPIFAGANARFDALGVVASDVLVEDGAVSLRYAGTDGVTVTLGRTTRESLASAEAP
jgi:predicted GH43/DUF377 family glycosyl hydrolase